MMVKDEPEHVLRTLFEKAVDAVSSGRCVPQHLPDVPKGRTVVIGAGKASAAMAAVVEEAWPGDLHGVVVTADDHAVPTRRIEVIEARHPVPDSRNVVAARRILQVVQGLTEDDLVLCLISGGGSALLCLPDNAVTLENKQSVTRALLHSGAPVNEINIVRKHLSQIKGGRLGATVAPARLVNLIISDAPGDDPTVLASGPTVPDPTTCADALAVIKRYQIDVSPEIITHLSSEKAETPKPGDRRFANVETRIIATPQSALDAAAARAHTEGYTPLILSDSIEGEALHVAPLHAAIAKQIAQRGQPFAPPCVILSGGELTVTLGTSGRGGPNTEFILALAQALDGEPNVYGIACDTDGIDGSGDAAGAIVGPDTLRRAQRRGLDPKSYLIEHDSYGFFAEVGNLVITGPTLTNVADFRAIIVTRTSQLV